MFEVNFPRHGAQTTSIELMVRANYGVVIEYVTILSIFADRIRTSAGPFHCTVFTGSSSYPGRVATCSTSGLWVQHAVLPFSYDGIAWQASLKCFFPLYCYGKYASNVFIPQRLGPYSNSPKSTNPFDVGDEGTEPQGPLVTHIEYSFHHSSFLFPILSFFLSFLFLFFF